MNDAISSCTDSTVRASIPLWPPLEDEPPKGGALPRRMPCDLLVRALTHSQVKDSAIFDLFERTKVSDKAYTDSLVDTAPS